MNTLNCLGQVQRCLNPSSNCVTGFGLAMVSGGGISALFHNCSPFSLPSLLSIGAGSGCLVASGVFAFYHCNSCLSNREIALTSGSYSAGSYVSQRNVPVTIQPDDIPFSPNEHRNIMSEYAALNGHRSSPGYAQCSLKPGMPNESEVSEVPQPPPYSQISEAPPAYCLNWSDSQPAFGSDVS